MVKRKKEKTFFSISTAVFLSLLLFSKPLAAAPALSTPGLSGMPANQVGIAAAVRGVVKVGGQGQVGRVVESGEAIHLGDEISTDEKGSLQILLLDETTFTIGPNSAIVIDKFVYDPSNHEGEVKAKVVKGVFRFVTGKIARKHPSQMEVEVPSGTIGIRGTIVAGETVGKKSMVVLLGPGEKNNTPHRQGSFTLAGEGGGRESFVGKSGFGATLDETGVPSNPFQVPQIDLDRLTKALGPVTQDSGPQAGSGGGSGDSGDGDGDGEGGESPTEQSGQGTAMAGESAGAFNALAAFAQGLVGDSNKAAQNALESDSKIRDGISTFRDLTTIPSGIFHYAVFAGANTVGGGTHTLKFNIDFGNRQVGGGTSNFSITGASAGSATIPITPFGASGSNAVFDYNFPNVFCSGSCSANLHIALANSDGIPASNAVYSFATGAPVATGSGVMSRQEGIAP